MGEKDVHAFWESTCLKGEASMISVWFADITGDIQVKGPSGFTTSFKQKGHPTVLRLQESPVDRLGDDDEMCDMWLRPDNSSRLAVATATLDETIFDDPLEVQYTKLEELKAQLTELHQQFHDTEINIMSLIKAEFKSCTNLKCVWNTAKSSAPSICKLISAHFSHHSGRVAGCTDGDAQSPCRAQGQDSSQEQKTAPQSAEIIETVEEEPHSLYSSAIPTPPAFPAHDEIEDTDIHESDELPKSSGDHSESHSWFESTEASAHDALATFQDNTARMQHLIRRHLLLAVVSLVLLVLVGGVIFRIVQICRDPRRRAERAARREEFLTRRLYRKAACKHKWRTWWKQLKRQATGDYEEKRQMILEREGISQDSLQRHILTLRDATDLVRNLVAAEEGRAQGDYRAAPARYQSSYPSPYTSSSYDAGVGSSRGSDNLPAYAPPPRYEEELEGEITVVDGFMYPASTTDDATESSIVDCSPRLSFETGRSTILTRDARD
ncbi:uncharacterized protein A1O9_05277 [Exophiala aquamarina CBS 119918]|uniref:Uncharacterized protein n=1 Tax=Exophiala aquamarina CBS 119918 TaxID=1182545 RepID=A0A072PPE2_9EURO|nr:uncharacterized protein A1O9_05277 [Exophiala aquamarina CBS 119918]KEF57360.1 hypothetical protein A1O9_05277 [Exophiala aquamarina CBS 119918]